MQLKPSEITAGIALLFRYHSTLVQLKPSEITAGIALLFRYHSTLVQLKRTFFFGTKLLLISYHSTLVQLKHIKYRVLLETDITLPFYISAIKTVSIECAIF